MIDVSHGYHIFRDGKAWCAVGPHFQNLQESPSGFGNTPDEAVVDLHSALVKDRWWDNKVMPAIEKFTIHRPHSVTADQIAETISEYLKVDVAPGDCRRAADEVLRLFDRVNQ